MFDTIVCGGGAAGLAAATWLGRYRRKTLVVDSGSHRNRFASSAHGYLGNDGAAPGDLVAAACKDLERYGTVELRDGAVSTAHRGEQNFVIRIDDAELETKRVLLATGVEDEFPDVAGFHDFYGKSIFHCSCCDGYEASEQRVAAIGWSPHVAGFALDLLDWGAKVVLLTTGKSFEGDEACRAALDRHEIEIIEDPVRAVTTNGTEMTGLQLEGGREIPCDKAFFSIAHRPRNALARQLGCELDDQGYVTIGGHGETSVNGVYAAGDLTPGEQLLQVAAAQGAIAGIACAMSLRGEYGSPGTPAPGPDPAEEIEAAS